MKQNRNLKNVQQLLSHTYFSPSDVFNLVWPYKKNGNGRQHHSSDEKGGWAT